MLSTAPVYPDGSVKCSVLGSSNAPISHKPQIDPATVEARDGSIKRSQRGLKGISSEAKRRLRSALVILEEIYGKENLSFLTCTIPVLSIEHHYQVVKYWGEIERRFIQSLKRLALKRGIKFLHVSVTELQGKRQTKYGMPFPHLHIVFPGRIDRYSQWAISVKEITNLWQRALANNLGFEPDCNSATNIQQVKVSVKRYLSKYMSKGGDVLDQLINAGLGQYIPKNWYSCSRELSKMVQDRIFKLDQETTEYMYDNREYLKSIKVLSWFHIVTIDVIDYQTGFEYTRNIGFVGCFNDKIPIADIPRILKQLMNGTNCNYA